jgi:TPP-dependent pyruvate/acetoin dehydrogenase alpha subunit
MGEDTAAARWLDPGLDRIEIDPGPLEIEPEELERWYRAMRLARTFEERLARVYRQGKVEGAVYLGMGQEGTSVGTAAHFRDGDYWSTVARNLSAWFLRGVDPDQVMARWLGKYEPPQHGRELGLFLADLEGVGLIPYHNGSMASWIPEGAGFAWSLKRKGQGNVYVAFTGDGATSPGDFYEGLSLAALHKLPIVVVAENNQYAYSTPANVQMPVDNIADRAAAFGIPSAVGFGSDVFEVHRLAGEAIAHAREGGGPYLLEFKCFRQRGHGEHDDMGYVDEEQREFWTTRDPIRLFRDYLVRDGVLSEERLAEIDASCGERVDAAVEYAERAPLPRPESVAEGVFA